MIKIMLADKRFNIQRRRLGELAKRVLQNESVRGRAIKIVYCSDNLIIGLNSQFKRKNRTTDVLAFNLDDLEDSDFLGEIYINLQQARRQAAENKVHYKEEVERLTIHGVLHLLGYTDENKKNRAEMWDLQESYLNKWKI